MVDKEHVYGIIPKSDVERNYLHAEYTIINFKHMQAYSPKVSRKKLLHKGIYCKVSLHICTHTGSW